MKINNKSVKTLSLAMFLTINALFGTIQAASAAIANTAADQRGN
jgi:hypothetical protein